MSTVADGGSGSASTESETSVAPLHERADNESETAHRAGTPDG